MSENINTILDDFEDLAARLSGLLRQEQLNLSEGASLEATVSQKRKLLDELSTTCASLREYRENAGRVRSAEQSRIEFLQQKLMSLLKLDRGVEKAYLSSTATRVHGLNHMPAASRVGQLYAQRS